MGNQELLVLALAAYFVAMVAAIFAIMAASPEGRRAALVSAKNGLRLGVLMLLFIALAFIVIRAGMYAVKAL